MIVTLVIVNAGSIIYRAFLFFCSENPQTRKESGINIVLGLLFFVVPYLIYTAKAERAH